MKILAFDTSNHFTSVAISDGEIILKNLENVTPSAQAEQLVPMIEAALRSCNYWYKDIDFIAVTNGPGSFTGIRIGLACAKALTINNDVLSSSVSNFEIYYYQALRQVSNWDKIIVLINAFREQLYVKIFDKFSDAEPMLLSFNEALKLIESLDKQNKLICTGDGVYLIYPQLNELSHITVLPLFNKIKARNICKFINQTVSLRKPLPITPLYIRPPDAKKPS